MHKLIPAQIIIWATTALLQVTTAQGRVSSKVYYLRSLLQEPPAQCIFCRHVPQKQGWLAVATCS